jgi:ParB/RepB/Spo0J family partition protein
MCCKWVSSFVVNTTENGSVGEKTMAEEIIREVPVKDIRDPARTGLNVRQTDRDVGVENLAASIKKHKLIQPIVLRGEFGEPPYELIAGHRRLAAHKLLRRDLIKARFKPHTYDDFKARVESLVENIQRVELNHADTAEAVTSMYKKYGRNERKVAEDLGLPLRTVRDYIKIEEMASDHAKDLLRKRKVEKADVKRAIDAAQGNLEKADRLLDAMPDLYGHERKRVVDYGREHPKASSEEIIKEAKKGRILKTIVLSIEPKVDNALEKAEHSLFMNREEIAGKALEEWLIEKGFLSH